MAAAFFNSVLILSILFVIGVIWFLTRNLEFGLIILVFFFPYLGLVIDFGQLEVFRDVPYLKNINAPFVDLYGLFFFVAWAINLVVRSFRIAPGEAKASHYILRSLPHLKSYLIFWFSGLISLLNVPALYLQTSIKYFARPFTFFYLVFFAPVVSILTRAHNPTSPPLTLRGGWEGLLPRVLTVFYLTGLLSALDGLLGLLFAAHPDFPRATPVGFLGINPLGPNHNLLAETLIATAPAGLILSRSMKYELGIMNWIKYGMFFQWGIALLTFGRTAWIVIALQVIVYYLLKRRHPERRGGSDGSDLATSGSGQVTKSHPALRMTLIGIFLVVIAFFVATTFSETVRGSTLSRLDQIRIATFYFSRAPIIGQGIGTFIPTLWQTRAFLLEYGEPLEAHGVVFKLMFEQGMLGLFTFAMFAGSIVWVIGKRYRATLDEAPLAALLIAVGALTYQLFNTTYYTSKLWIPLAIAVAIVGIRKQESGMRNQTQSTHNS